MHKTTVVFLYWKIYLGFRAEASGFVATVAHSTTMAGQSHGINLHLALKLSLNAFELTCIMEYIYSTIPFLVNHTDSLV